MKFGKLLLVFTLCLFSLMGCKASETEKETPGTESETKTEESVGTVAEMREIASSTLHDMNGWSEVSRYTGDTDSDGEDEEVVLMTSAERDAKGEIIWNDGQNWVMYVKDGKDAYVLLDKYIQTGNVYFEILDYYQKEGTEPKINTIISTGTGFGMYSYTFDVQKNVYTEEVLYDTATVTEAGTNRRFSTLSEMQ